MQVRRGAVADIAALGNYLTLANTLTFFHAAAALSDVPIKGVRFIFVADRYAIARLGGAVAIVLIDDSDDKPISGSAHGRAGGHRKVKRVRAVAAVRDAIKPGVTENELGNIYGRAGQARQALRHYQQAIQHHEIRGNIYAAGRTRQDVAVLLANDGRIGDALQYARAALHNYEQAGPGAADRADRARQLIAELEQHNR